MDSTVSGAPEPKGIRKHLSNLLIGRPLETRTLAHQVVSNKVGLAVFAPAPDGPIGALRRARLWLLRRTLGRPLYTLGHGDGPLTWTEPSAAPRPAVVPMAGVKRL